MGAPGNPAEMLQGYVQAHFDRVENSKVHARVWLTFLSACSKREADRALNTTAVSAGTNRLMLLLSSGRAAGIFSHTDDYGAARALASASSRRTRHRDDGGSRKSPAGVLNAIRTSLLGAD